jgi:VWFA-related protein
MVRSALRTAIARLSSRRSVRSFRPRGDPRWIAPLNIAVRPFVALLVAAVVSVVAVSGQEPASQPAPVFGTAATAVLVDVVVRDAAGNLVTDLDAKNFSVSEDGVRQTIATFEPARGPRPDSSAPEREVRSTGAAPGARAGTGPTGAPRLVALVFEQLGAEARAAAHKAARTYLREQRSGDEFVGVFVVERALQTILPYTRDAAAAERAVRTAVMRPGCPQQVVGDVPGAEHGGEGCRDEVPNRVFATETMNGLRAVVEPLQLVPGRKSVLLFSEGFSLEVTSDVMARFDALIGVANRSGVSFYTVDAAGLRAQNPSAGIRKRLRTYSAEDQTSLARDSVSPDEMMSAQPHVALGRLARETGGAFVDNTNELEQAGRRLSEDLRSFYLLGYTPTNAALDGGFRRITVEVDRPGVSVQARAGYLAVPTRRTLAPHDVAPLLALESGSLPHDFRLDAELTPSPGTLRILARVAHKGLTYEEAGASCRARLTILARAVDKDGRTLWMNSDAFDLSSPSPKCDAAKRLASEFVRDVSLPPNATRVDVIAYDAIAGRASARQFDVPAGRR